MLCWRKVGADPELRWVRTRVDASGEGQERCEQAWTAHSPKQESKGITPFLMEKGEKRRLKAWSCKQRHVLAAVWAICVLQRGPDTTDHVHTTTWVSELHPARIHRHESSTWQADHQVPEISLQIFLGGSIIKSAVYVSKLNSLQGANKWLRRQAEVLKEKATFASCSWPSRSGRSCCVYSVSTHLWLCGLLCYV